MQPRRTPTAAPQLNSPKDLPNNGLDFLRAAAAVTAASEQGIGLDAEHFGERVIEAQTGHTVVEIAAVLTASALRVLMPRRTLTENLGWKGRSAWASIAAPDKALLPMPQRCP